MAENGPSSAWHSLAALWRRLTEPSPSIREPERRRRARLLSALLVVTLPLDLAGLGLIPLGLFSGPQVGEALLWVTGGSVALLAVVFGLSRTRYSELAAALTVIIALGTTFAAVILNRSDPVVLAYLSLGGLMSGLFLSPRATAAVFVGTLLGMLALPVLGLPHPLTQMINALFFVTLVGALIVIAAAVRRQDMTQIEQQSRRLAEREERLQAAIQAAQQANAQLSERVKELEQRTSEIGLLSRLGEMLQTCQTAAEAHDVLVRSARQLFPHESGAVYQISASRNFAEAVTAWGEAADPLAGRVFAPEDCWALRRGRIHAVLDPQVEVVCEHVIAAQRSPTPYMCVPMMAQGEALGIVHLSANGSAGLTDVTQRLAQAVAEQLALALANLRLRDTLRRQSIRDPLTGLFNRRYLEETLEREVQRAARSRSSLGVIMLDIDHFKQFNDTSGHEAGDVLLHELGGFLLKRTRGSDIACRYGGEEFALILPDASFAATRQRAEELRQGVTQLQVEYRGQLLGPISVSLGVAAFPDHGLNKELLLRVADAALYRAKREGRNRVAVSND